MDADLEADLGIDSIKKAQMFGEIGEYFAIAPDETVSLDDFPHLRSVLDFLIVATQSSDRVVTPRGQSTAAVAQAPVVLQTQAVAVTQAVAETQAVAVTQAANSAGAGGPSADQLKSFLINFVVEQTGYPEDIVELDADLEADLGIDSIKKAQMFGEIGEYFGIRPDDSLSLDAFPDLQSVLVYLLRATSAPGVSTPVASPAVTAVSNARPDDSVKPSDEDLKSFLVNFVVEQTGYPEDIVELDADLEADLGIDSIKKAQMFGEIGEYFGIQPDASLSLDDFRDLRSVLEFLGDKVGGSA
jgi:acyl carrier protein